MPGKSSRRVLSLTGLLVGLQTTLVLLASRAMADPSPTPSPTPSKSDDPCDQIHGAGREYCRDQGRGDAPGSEDPTNPIDPAASLARACADAASWLVGKLSDLVNETAGVDFTNETFLRQYAVVFAASTVLTLLLWLLAVAKRAIRGVPFIEAITEAIGFLWLTVLASAFTPLILYTVVSATDAVTEVISSGTGADNDAFFGSFAKALKKDEDIGGGPIMLIVVSLVTILAAGVLCLELVIRAALLYVGALLGTAVYAGLVDKNMWGHVRRWAGLMIAVILVKPVIVVVLGLAGALSGDEGPDAFSAVVSGLSIIILAIFASAMIYRFVPGFGDEIISSRNASNDAASRQAAAIVSSPAALVKQGMSAHSNRAVGGSGGGGGGDGGSGASQPRPANPVSGGVAAHSSRGSGSGSDSGGGRAPAAPPAPRTQNSNTSKTGNTSKPSGGDRR
ncbi:hypothetical protein [Streptomyces zagrosensis]|uniref:Integral membrane protein n=1 Tax=Streptomyces zagrosensis TaxID=1042984 RepID=A0A7W9V2A5_9ACTN|nr:hypothetical protein [Streptomyces zagrosensis]MBB5940128.1 hypothetical protein [Streptomyces zagrosensis]